MANVVYRALESGIFERRVMAQIVDEPVVRERVVQVGDPKPRAANAKNVPMCTARAFRSP